MFNPNERKVDGRDEEKKNDGTHPAPEKKVGEEKSN